jgi:integrase
MDELRRQIEAFLQERRAMAARSSTLANYRHALLKVLLPWLREQGITELGQLTDADLDRLSIALQERPRRGQEPDEEAPEPPLPRLSQATVWTYLRNIRLFLAWARQHDASITARGRLPRLPRRQVARVLSREEIRRLERAETDERNRLIIRVLGDTGMRPGELISLRVSDLMSERRRNFLLVRGKTGEREVAITPELTRRLREYVATQRPRSDHPQLFLGMRRTAHDDYPPLTVSGLRQMVRDLGDRVLGFRITPKSFRISVATWLVVERRMNPMFVAMLLGHRSTAMLERHYAQVGLDDARQALLEALLDEEP